MRYLITGKNKLCGEYRLSRAKNSALTLMCASMLVAGETLIKKCPKISDVFTLSEIMQSMGATVVFKGDDLYINAKDVYLSTVPEKLSKNLRASLFLLGPLVARFGCAAFCSTGGCSIGTRPTDIHLDGFKRLGATVGEADGMTCIFAARLEGAAIRMRYPSVGATVNLVTCATLAVGTTVIENCAREPEIVDLQNYLNACGANVKGAGTGTMTVAGVKKLTGGVLFTPLPDRIECGSILLSALACGGEVTVLGAKYKNIGALTEKLLNNTCKISIYNDRIYIKTNKRHKGFGNVVAAPYPMLATDLQPQLAACACTADGTTTIIETVFDGRFAYVEELKRMGADVRLSGGALTVNGGRLHGASVTAKDLRGGMALVIAALSAEGASVVDGVSHIERGYEDLHLKLSALGADIKKL